MAHTDVTFSITVSAALPTTAPSWWKPPGVTLTGSIISGTPTAPFAKASVVASADDGH